MRRYGELVARAAAQDPTLVTTEVALADRTASWRTLRHAARRLADVDVVHLQWKPADWSDGGSRALRALLAFTLSCRRPIVVTLHDVYPRHGLKQRLLRPDALALRWLGARARRVVVHSDEERRRLAGLVPSARLRVVPHFVEERAPLIDRAEAKALLGIAPDRRLATLLGYITARKGHALLIESLAHLPEDVTAVVAGSGISGRTIRIDELRELTERLSLGDRVLFTGYLDDARLELLLAATDVAVCPFRDVSASGSLSTWIATGRPLVVSDLPAFREYDDLAPGALTRFAPYAPAALASAIGAVLHREPGMSGGSVAGGAAAAADLRERLSLERIVARYRALYRGAAAARAPANLRRTTRRAPGP